MQSSTLSLCCAVDAAADHHEHEHDKNEGDHPNVDSGERGRHIPVKVWGTSDRASQFGHAKEVACHAVQTMEQLLQVGGGSMSAYHHRTVDILCVLLD